MARRTTTATTPPRPGEKKQATNETRGPTAEDRFAAFSARYKWYFFVPILAGIVLAIILAIASDQRRRERLASIQTYDAARTVEDFDAVADDFPGTFLGRQALATAGDLLFEQRRYAQAREHYNAYLATAPEPALGAPVRTAIVQTYIAEADYLAAIDACNETLNAPGRDFVEMQTLYYRAYCYEMRGDLENAKAEYLKVTRAAEAAGGMGVWYAPAQMRLATIERKLKATNKKPEKNLDTDG